MFFLNGSHNVSQHVGNFIYKDREIEKEYLIFYSCAHIPKMMYLGNTDSIHAAAFYATFTVFNFFPILPPQHQEHARIDHYCHSL